MRVNHLAAVTLFTLLFAGAACAQTVLSRSDDGSDNARQHLSNPHGPAASRTRADRSGAPAKTDAGPRDVVTRLMGDVAGVLNTMFGIRDSSADDPGSLARE